MAVVIFSKSSGLNDTIYGKSEAAVRAFIQNRVSAVTQLSIYNKLFKKMSSTKYAEKIATMTGMASGFKPGNEGMAYPFDEMQEGYSKIIASKTWKDAFVVTQEMVEDDVLLDVGRIGATAFADRFNDDREDFAANMLRNAYLGQDYTYEGVKFDTTSSDGVALFSTAHTSITGNQANQSNKYSNAFSAEILARMQTAMQNLRDDNGKRLTVRPDTIVIPNDYTLKDAVFKAIGSEKDPGNANNGYNYMFGQWNVIVSPFLNDLVDASHKPYFLFDSKYNDAYYGLIALERVPLTIKAWVDENTDNCIWGGRARHTIAFNDWRTIAVGDAASGTDLTA